MRRPAFGRGCMPGPAGSTMAGPVAPRPLGAWACAHSGLRRSRQLEHARAKSCLAAYDEAGRLCCHAVPQVCLGECVRVRASCAECALAHGCASWEGAFLGNRGICQPCSGKAGSGRRALNAALGRFWVAQLANSHTLHDKDTMLRAQAGTRACLTAWWSVVGAAGTEVFAGACTRSGTSMPADGYSFGGGHLGMRLAVARPVTRTAFLGVPEEVMFVRREASTAAACTVSSLWCSLSLCAVWGHTCTFLCRAQSCRPSRVVWHVRSFQIHRCFFA